MLRFVQPLFEYQKISILKEDKMKKQVNTKEVKVDMYLLDKLH